MYELHVACQKGDLKKVKRHISKETLYQVDTHGKTPSNYAIEANQPHIVKYLIQQFEETFIPTLDSELRSYILCLTALANYNVKGLTYKEALTPILKIYDYSQKIKHPLEFDRSLQASLAGDIGIIYCHIGDDANAKKYYLMGLEDLLLLSAESTIALKKTTQYFMGLGKCHLDNSPERNFYFMAARCFLNLPDTEQALTTTIHDLLIKPLFNTELYESAILLLRSVLHQKKIGVLPNQQLNTYLASPKNIDRLQSSLQGLQEKLASHNCKSNVTQLFATVDNNLPPEDLTKVHDLTEQESNKL